MPAQDDEQVRRSRLLLLDEPAVPGPVRDPRLAASSTTRSSRLDHLASSAA
jgi:hypothetical protein